MGNSLNLCSTMSNLPISKDMSSSKSERGMKVATFTCTTINFCIHKILETILIVVLLCLCVRKSCDQPSTDLTSTCVPKQHFQRPFSGGHPGSTYTQQTFPTNLPRTRSSLLLTYHCCREIRPQTRRSPCHWGRPPWPWSPYNTLVRLHQAQW